MKQNLIGDPILDIKDKDKKKFHRKRSQLYFHHDEHGSNLRPYIWITVEGKMIYGQDIHEWMPLPKYIRKEANYKSTINENTSMVR